MTQLCKIYEDGREEKKKRDEVKIKNMIRVTLKLNFSSFTLLLKNINLDK